MNLTKSQNEALNKIENFINSDEHIFLLKGGAGTGKTTIIREIIKIILKNEKTLSISAPTGRAVSIISKILNNSNVYLSSPKVMSTIHSMIYRYQSLNIIDQKNIENSDTFNFNFILKNNDDSINHVYIIDEASMIGNNKSESEFLRFGSGKLLSDLIDYSECVEPNNNKKIIFIGDDSQLPPVDNNNENIISPALSANYLKSNFSNLKINEFSLKEIHRQNKSSLILENSLIIRKQLQENKFNFFDLKNDKESFIHYDDVYELIEKFLEHFKLGEINNPVIITWKNSSVKKYNDIIRKRIFKDNTLDLKENETLMIIQNNLMHNVSNGENCIVDKIYSSTEVINQPITRVGGGKPLIVELKFKNVRLRKFNYELNQEELFDAKIIENTLDADVSNIDANTNRALFVYVKNKIIEKTGDKNIIKNNPNLFSEILLNDSYFNAIHVKYGYSITCHKSQGGEYEEVFVDFAPSTNILSEQYFRWAYTAITRAKKKLFSINNSIRYIKKDIFDDKKKFKSTKTTQIFIKDNDLVNENSSEDWKIELKKAVKYCLGEKYDIQNNNSITEFHERYFIKNKFNELFTIDFHRKKNGKITILGSNKDLKKCLNIEYIIVNENMFNVDKMNIGQKNIFNKLNQIIDNNVIISKIENLPYMDRYYLKKNYEIAIIEYSYTKKGICTTSKPITDNKLTEEILK